MGAEVLFALPLNSRYQHFNSSGRARARLASTNNLALMLNLFHNDSFVFDNGYAFPERQGTAKYFSGEGEFIPVRPGRNMWETNFIPDLAGFELKAWDQRGAGGSNMMFILADGTMHAHTSQMPGRPYKKAHRHGADFHVFAVTGHRFSLLWYEGAKDFVRIDWKHGWVFAPPDQMFHQHFNTARDPARYLAVAFGSLRYPFTTDKRHVFLGMDVSVKDGGCQIEYEHQDPRIHGIYLEELGKHGVTSGHDQVHRRAVLRQDPGLRPAQRRNARPRVRAPARQRRGWRYQRGRLGRRQCRADHRRDRHRIVHVASDVRPRASAAAVGERCPAASSWSGGKFCGNRRSC